MARRRALIVLAASVAAIAAAAGCGNRNDPCSGGDYAAGFRFHGHTYLGHFPKGGRTPPLGAALGTAVMFGCGPRVTVRSVAGLDPAVAVGVARDPGIYVADGAPVRGGLRRLLGIARRRAARGARRRGPGAQAR